MRPLWLLAMLTTGGVALAQGDDGSDADPIEDSATSVDQAEPRAAPDATDERATAERAVGEISYRLIGYLRLEAAVVQDDPGQEFVGRTDGFRLQNARVGVEGRWLDRMTIRLSADGAIDERDNPNEIEGTLRFALKDAYADIHLAPLATIRIARFQILFDIERFTSPSQRSFARRALSSRGVAATEGFEKPGLAVRRNLGIALRSENLVTTSSMALGYELAAQNGNGESDAANDNDALAYSAALFGKLGGSVWAFVAGRYNRRNEGELPFRRTEDDLEGAAGVRLVMKPLRVTGQVLYRRSTFVTTGGPTQNAYGAHGEALLTIPGQGWLEAGYRYSILEPNDLMPADRIQEHTIGINIAAPRLRSQLQLNATHAVEQSGSDLENSRIEAVVQVSL